MLVVGSCGSWASALDSLLVDLMAVVSWFVLVLMTHLWMTRHHILGFGRHHRHRLGFGLDFGRHHHRCLAIPQMCGQVLLVEVPCSSDGLPREMRWQFPRHFCLNGL